MRALVIDDEEDIRRLLAAMLGRLGFDVVEAGNGREGLDRLRRAGAPDVALVDWRMPDMDGLDMVRALRADPAFEGMRVMMVTGLNEMDQIAEALEAGADEYLMKPVTQGTLAAKLALMGLAGERAGEGLARPRDAAPRPGDGSRARAGDLSPGPAPGEPKELP